MRRGPVSVVALAVLAVATASVATAAEPRVSVSGTDVVTGKPISTARYRGKPVLIVVWASW